MMPTNISYNSVSAILMAVLLMADTSNVYAFTASPSSVMNYQQQQHATVTKMMMANSDNDDVNESMIMGRRSALMKGFMTAAAVVAATGSADVANAAAAKTGLGSPFTGEYDDPNHPNCLRSVKVVGAPMRGDGTRSKYPVIEVVGWDGDGSDSTMCKGQPTREQLWKVTGSVKSTNDAVIDFSPKGGPTNLAAKFEDGGIVFPDGNKWKKLPPFVGQDRFPKDMTTLKSD